MGFIEDISPTISVNVWDEGLTFRVDIETCDDVHHEEYKTLSSAYRYAADRFLDLEHQARISELQERINRL